MCRAERRCRKRHEFKKGQAAFRANPSAAGKALLDPNCKATFRVDQRSLDEHKSSAVQDKLYDVTLSNLDGLPPSPPCSKPFPSSSLKYKDFLTLLSTRRNASSPGLNFIPYKVYKKSPQINTFLFNVSKSCLKNCVVPIQWREIFIPKCKTPMESNIKDFRPIALLIMEGKLLFSLV